MQIQISWLLQKPTDLDLHCLQRQYISGFSRTRVKYFSYFFFFFCLKKKIWLIQYLTVFYFAVNNLSVICDLFEYYLTEISCTRRVIIFHLVTLKWHLGPVVQNFTKLLANVMLKFLSWNMAITYTYDMFCWKNVNSFCIAKAKGYSHFCSKNINVSMYLKIP